MFLMMVSLLDDEQRDLIERIFKEDRRLFFNIARRILGSITEAEDAVSDAMIQITDNLEKIKNLPRHEMRAYCIVIVRNCSYGRFRRNKHELRLDEVGSDIADERNEPGEIYIRQERIKAVRKMIQELSKEDGLLLQLRFYHQSSYKEIADILGITEETARKRAERIRRIIRLRLDGEHYE